MTGIYISHSSDAPFTEKRFIVDLVQQLKENNLADDVWLVFIDLYHETKETTYTFRFNRHDYNQQRLECKVVANP